MLHSVYDQLDRVRRLQGQLLDMIGLAPIETPSRVVYSVPPVTLKAYGDRDKAGPVLLIVPAPIKRAYIWDLIPRSSVVQQCLHSGVHVYMIHWGQPDHYGANPGLAEYACQYLLDCLDAIAAEFGEQRAFLAGHSLGGVFAAIFAALHPERIRGLILLSAPLHFGADSGAFAPLVALASHAQPVVALVPNVPGSFLNTVSVLAAPDTFLGARWADWLNSLSDAQALYTHLLVRRWTLDELPLSSKLFKELVELLYLENSFMAGTLTIQGRLAAPALVEAPILSVLEVRSRVVPPQSVLPFHAAVGSGDVRVLWYGGDIGVALQHIGMLVGRQAHQELWPEILRWLHAHSEGG